MSGWKLFSGRGGEALVDATGTVRKYLRGTPTAAPRPLRPSHLDPYKDQIGRWIRDFQSAQAGLVLDPAKPWRRAEGTSTQPGLVIVHHDVSPPLRTMSFYDEASQGGRTVARVEQIDDPDIASR